MKLIKDLRVSVKYTAGGGNIEVPDDIYEKLMDRDEFDCNDQDDMNVVEWLSSKFDEKDAMYWSYEIDNIE